MKKFVLVGCMLFAYVSLFAQDAESSKGFKKEKLFAGGGLGLTLGSYTLINLSPQIGYRFNKYLATGTGLNLIYTSLKEKDLNNRDYRKVVQGIAGLNIFGRFYPARQFLIQFQPEGNYIFGKQTFYQPTKQTYKLDAEIVPSLLAGGGFVMPSAHGEFIITLMYDLLQKVNSPYGKKAIVNVGYNMNF